MTHAMKQITLSYIPLTAETVKNVAAPSATEMSAYFENNKTAFTTNEMRDYTLLTLDAETLMDTINVTSTMAQSIYDSDPEAYTAEETRQISHIVVSTEQQAHALYTELSQGLSFADSAQKHSIDTFTKSKGGRLGHVTHTELPLELADIAFDLALNDISKPVKSVLGWHVLTVTEITPSSVQSFDDAKEEIIAEIKQQKAEDLYYSLQDQIGTYIDEGQSLSHIAASLSLPVITHTQVDASAQTELINTAFSLEMNEISLPQDMPGRTAVQYVQTTHIDLSRPQTYAEAMPAVKDIIHEKNLRNAIQNKATFLAEYLKENNPSWDTFTHKAGIAPQQVLNVYRSGENAPEWLQTFNLSALFALPSGGILTYPVTTDGGLVFVAVTQRSTATWDDNRKTTFTTNLNQTITQELFDQFSKHLVHQTDVDMNVPALQQILGSEFTGVGGNE